MAVPNIFGSATSAIPLSQLDTNFATPVTIGNTAVQLGNTVTSFGNVTLTNVTISSGNVTVSAGSNTAPSITTVGDTNTGIFFPAADTIAFSEGGVESMRIDTSGNVGIGTGSPSTFPAKFAVSGFVASGGQNYSAGFSDAVNSTFRIGHQSGLTNLITDAALAFYTASAERMRIDSSGNVVVGATSASGNGTILTLKNPSNATVWGTGPNSNGTFLVYNASGVGVYLGSGATSWSSSSDERIKTTIVPFENALEKVCTLRAGTGRYLKDEETVSRSFLIAQDVQAVLPEAVNVQDDEIGTLGLQYTDVIPLLVAAIKEQNQLITVLTARITALETP